MSNTYFTLKILKFVIRMRKSYSPTQKEILESHHHYKISPTPCSFVCISDILRTEIPEKPADTSGID